MGELAEKSPKRDLSEYTKFPLGAPIAGSVADPDSAGYIYVIGADELPMVKIGSAKSVAARLIELQCGNPYKLHLRAAVSLYDVDRVLVEFATHRLAAERGKHFRGEWFEMPPMQAVLLVIEAAQSLNARFGSAFAAMQRVDAAHRTTAIEGGEEERRRLLRIKLGMD